jgi:dephospho-CoA kinase
MSMLHIGLTGNVASGKSRVAARLAELGATILDADRQAREAIAPGTPALARVIARFGPAVLHADGSLNRAALGRVVFNDEAARRDLEAIVHPEVARLRASDLATARSRGAQVVVSDVPLLFEAGLEREFDAIMLVHAPEETRRQRLTRDRGLSDAEARAVMAAQGDPEEKRRRATWVIENDGSLADLDHRVEALWPTIATMHDRLEKT